MILFTYLKIILLQCFQFQFSVFNNKRYSNRPLNSMDVLLNNQVIQQILHLDIVRDILTQFYFVCKPSFILLLQVN